MTHRDCVLAIVREMIPEDIILIRDYPRLTKAVEPTLARLEAILAAHVAEQTKAKDEEIADLRAWDAKHEALMAAQDKALTAANNEIERLTAEVARLQAIVSSVRGTMGVC